MSPLKEGLGSGVCDSHMHVFGPPDRYPVERSASYAPPPATVEDYTTFASASGIDRFVVVQPSIYGADNRCVLDALAAAGRDRARGVAILPEDRAPSRTELQDWDGAGICGLRVIAFPPDQKAHVAGPGAVLEPGPAAEVRRRVEATAAVADEQGWHLDLLAPASVITMLAPTLAELPVDYTVAHLGLSEAHRGLEQPDVAAFLELVAHPSGRCWPKLTAPYRISQAAGWADVEPLFSALLAAAPNRVVWGSDWPHVQFRGRVDTTHLIETTLQWIPDARLAHDVLVGNPALLYGFEKRKA